MDNVLTTGWDGFGNGLVNSRFQGIDAAGISLADIPKLHLRWAFGLGDITNARGQPVISAGRLFITSGAGKVYAVDSKTGCLFWEFTSEAPIRSGVVTGGASVPAVFFGDAKAHMYALDAASGKLMWKVHVESHPAAVITDAPSYYQGVVYVGVSSFEEVLGADPKYECCKFSGSVVALDAATGETICTRIPDRKRTEGARRIHRRRWSRNRRRHGVCLLRIRAVGRIAGKCAACVWGG